jgi:hypothetical protein
MAPKIFHNTPGIMPTFFTLHDVHLNDSYFYNNFLKSFQFYILYKTFFVSNIARSNEILG